MELARRDFLKGAALTGAAAVAGSGLLSVSEALADEAEAEEESEESEDVAEEEAEEGDEGEDAESLGAAYDALDASAIEEAAADLVVIGAGPSGMAAAVTAAEQGLSVIVLEKTSSSGGCAKYGMGPLAIGTKYQEEQGLDYDLDEMFNEFVEYTHYRTNVPLVREYFERSNETLEWIEDMGVTFDEAAQYFEKSYATWHLVHSEEGVSGGGQAKTMTDHMQSTAEDLGVVFYFEEPACRLELEDGAICGVCATSADETSGMHITTKAAVVATGGFGNSEEMVEEQFGLKLDEDFFGMRFSGHEGDGVKMVWEAGGAQSDMIEEVIFDIYQQDSEGSYTYDVHQVMLEPNLLVNKEGKRFFNEEQVQNTTYTGNSLLRQTGNTGFMIMDEDIKEGYVEANEVPFNSKVFTVEDFTGFDESFEEMEESGYTAIVRADTLDELAEMLGIDAEGLSATVEEYNQICADGYDPLGKSAEYLQPIQTAPFYAAQYYPSAYGTLGGVTVDEELQVLDDEGAAIGGLFAAGTDTCTIYGDSYMFLMPGNTMGYSINSGRFAGESVIEYLEA